MPESGGPAEWKKHREGQRGMVCAAEGGGSEIKSRNEGGAMVNRVTLVGRLGKKPEMRYTQDGSAVANMALATDETWKDKNGEKVQKTEWHKLVCFGKLAEICDKYLDKGKLIFVEGKLQTKQWEDKDGNKRFTTEIIVSEMKMLEGKKQEQQQGQGPSDPMDDVPF